MVLIRAALPMCKVCSVKAHVAVAFFSKGGRAMTVKKKRSVSQSGIKVIEPRCAPKSAAHT